MAFKYSLLPSFHENGIKSNLFNHTSLTFFVLGKICGIPCFWNYIFETSMISFEGEYFSAKFSHCITSVAWQRMWMTLWYRISDVYKTLSDALSDPDLIMPSFAFMISQYYLWNTGDHVMITPSLACVLRWLPKLLFCIMSLKIILLKSVPYFPGASELMCVNTWWRHQMETFSALLAICAENSPVPGEFSAKRPVTLSFDVFFDLRPNKRLSKRS